MSRYLRYGLQNDGAPRFVTWRNIGSLSNAEYYYLFPISLGLTKTFLGVTTALRFLFKADDIGCNYYNYYMVKNKHI